MEDRVSLVLADCGRTLGPQQRGLWELATGLSRARFHLRVWLSAADEVEPLAHALEDRAILVERIRDDDSRWGWRSRLDVRRRFIGARPALLHLHRGSTSGDRLAAALIEAAGGARVVMTHAGTAPHPIAPAPRLRRAIGRVDAWTAFSGAAADRLAGELGLERGAVRIVREGFDPPDPETEAGIAAGWRDRLGASPVRPLWVAAAALEADHGFETLIEAMAEVHGRGVPFVLACAGEGSHREALERRVEELGLQARIRFVGEPGDPGPLIGAADLVVQPAAGEGIPAALVHALARVKPVVAAETAGVAELIEDGLSGRLVPAGDARALADAIETAYRRSDAARRMATQGALRVREEFSWTRFVEACEEVYDEVLGFASFEPERGAVRDGRRA